MEHPELDLYEARRQSSMRVLDVWSQLAERYTRRIDEDDIVDLRDGSLVKDRGILRSSTKAYPIGHFASTQLGGDSDGTDGQTDGEGEDELDGFADANISDELQKVPPVKVTDPADAEDLREFLEAEKLRKEACGDEEDDAHELERVESSDGEEAESEVSNGKTYTEFEEELNDMAPSKRRQYEPDTSDESEDELGKWERDEGSAVYQVAQDESEDEIEEVTIPSSSQSSPPVHSPPPLPEPEAEQELPEPPEPIREPTPQFVEPPSPVPLARGRSHSRKASLKLVVDVPPLQRSKSKLRTPKRKPSPILPLRATSPELDDIVGSFTIPPSEDEQPVLEPVASTSSPKTNGPPGFDKIGPPIGKKRKRLSSISISKDKDPIDKPRPVLRIDDFAMSTPLPKGKIDSAKGRKHKRVSSETNQEEAEFISQAPDVEPVEVQPQNPKPRPRHKSRASPSPEHTSSDSELKIPHGKDKRHQHEHAYSLPPPDMPYPQQPYSPYYSSPYPPPPLHGNTHGHPLPPPAFPLQGPHAQYLIAQAMQHLSFLMTATGHPSPGHPPPPGWPQDSPRASYPPPWPPNDHARAPSSSSSSASYTTPARFHLPVHSHTYSPTPSLSLSGSTLPPSSAEPPSPPARRAPSLVRGRSKSRGRHVSFNLGDSEHGVAIHVPEIETAKSRQSTPVVKKGKGKARMVDLADVSDDEPTRGRTATKFGRAQTPGPPSRPPSTAPPARRGRPRKI